MPVVDTAPHNGAGETILLVEDEEGVRNFGAEILEELGYRVLTAEHGVAALAVLDAHPELALLFTDVVLTGPMNGRMLADEAARRRPNLPVLFTTGYTSDAIIHHGRLDEGINFIGKPFTAAALAQAIRQALDQVVHATPAPAKS
jgi:CheY-like chemotaxis protein